VEADPRVRALEIKGSMARGAADEHSDLDTRVWISDDDFDAAVADLPVLARAVAMPLDILLSDRDRRFSSSSLLTAFSWNFSPDVRVRRRDGSQAKSYCSIETAC